MECKFCRSEIPEGATMCPNCGTPVEPTTQETGQQGGYEYGMPNSQNPQGEYGYGAPNQNQQGGYEYGAPNQNQQNGYEYGAPNQNQQSGYEYGVPNQNPQGGYGQPQKPISSTPYMIFAIITTILCCLPLGIAAIVYASKINTLQRVGDYEGARKAAKKAKTCTIISLVIGLIASIFYIVIAVVGLKDDMPSAPLSVVEDRDDEDRADDVEEKKEPAAPAKASGELGDSWESYTVQINDTVLTFPCEIKELEAAGLKLDSEYMPENYVVNAEEYELGYFEDANGNYIMADLINTTDEPKEAKECLVGGIGVDEYGLEAGGMTVIFPGGIQMGMEKKDVIGAYGETEDIYEGDSVHMYTWYAKDFAGYCEIDLDAANGLVTNMRMVNYTL